MRFGTQVGISPPTYALSLNHPVDLHFSYRRYLENQLRETLDLEGTPVVIKVRTRSNASGDLRTTGGLTQAGIAHQHSPHACVDILQSEVVRFRALLQLSH